MECTKRKFLIGYRAFFGLLTLTAIGKQLTIQLQGGFSLTNFFSFFTNLSNLFAAIILILGAIYLIKRREPTVKDDIIRGTSVACMALVGMVFSVLLRDVDLGHLLPWVNILLHYIMPIVILIDWLYQPPKNKLKLGQIVYWLIFPLLYLAYSIIRGAILGFYAYPFFNPAKSGGYGGVALYCIAIAATFFFFSWLLIAVGNKLNKECVIDTL
jgi:hypothetical protein